MNWRKMIAEGVRNSYEFYNINNAVEIMQTSFQEEWQEINDMLAQFSITVDDIKRPGGNQSPIPKVVSALLEPKGWRETRLTGDLIINIEKYRPKENEEHLLKDYLSGYKIDYVKRNIAIDIEWNSKDQTYDRDLASFRAFYDTGVINAAVIMTRSISLNPVFQHLGLMQKYGASTTQMGKLLPRINARRQGGCPLFVIGITPKQIRDYEGGIIEDDTKI